MKPLLVNWLFLTIRDLLCQVLDKPDIIHLFLLSYYIETPRGASFSSLDSYGRNTDAKMEHITTVWMWPNSDENHWRYSWIIYITYIWPAIAAVFKCLLLYPAHPLLGVFLEASPVQSIPPIFSALMISTVTQATSQWERSWGGVFNDILKLSQRGGARLSHRFHSSALYGVHI